MENKTNIKTGNSDELTINANTDNFRLEAGSGEIQLVPMEFYSWEPKEDITTYELAQCLPIVTAMQTMGAYYNNWKKQVNNLPQNCQRHFAKVEG